MADSETVSFDSDYSERLNAALAEFQIAIDDGEPLDHAEFLARHSDIAGDLAPLLEAAERVERHVRPFRNAINGNTPAALPQFDEYQILAEIGRGGMGVVYKAKQRGTDQIVALKMLRMDWINSLDADSRRNAVEQFRTEAKAAASLRHANRVRILHLGEHDGLPYYAMEYIDGCSLAEKLHREENVRNEARLLYVAGIAEALHEAHQRNILHRDVKPHNILIDDRDQALLADFGLAKIKRDDPEGKGRDMEGSVSRTARIAGTVPYMSPEATMDADNISKAGDIYSLGATLYELLTGRPPFQGTSRTELFERIRTEKPLPPRQLNPVVNPVVESICLKCLHKSPEDRFESAGDLANALRAHLSQVHHAGNYSAMGNLMMYSAPLMLLINLCVFILLQLSVFEPIIWLVIFSMYPALFCVFLLAPAQRSGHDYHLSRIELWAVWGGKLFSAICISIALRVAFRETPELAMLLAYPVFAALSGMAAFVMVTKMERKLYWLALAGWLTAIVMVFHLSWAPIFYGIYASAGIMILGYYFRKLGVELS